MLYVYSMYYFDYIYTFTYCILGVTLYYLHSDALVLYVKLGLTLIAYVLDLCSSTSANSSIILLKSLLMAAYCNLYCVQKNTLVPVQMQSTEQSIQ